MLRKCIYYRACRAQHVYIIEHVRWKSTLKSEGSTNFGYKINTLTRGELSILRYIGYCKILKFWSFVYKPSHGYVMLEKIEVDYVYSSVFDTHVKGGDCWSQIGFDKWVSTHLSYLLSSCWTSSTCRAQHVNIRPCRVIVSVESLMCWVTQVSSRQTMSSDSGAE